MLDVGDVVGEGGSLDLVYVRVNAISCRCVMLSMSKWQNKTEAPLASIYMLSNKCSRKMKRAHPAHLSLTMSSLFERYPRGTIPLH